VSVVVSSDMLSLLKLFRRQESRKKGKDPVVGPVFLLEFVANKVILQCFECSKLSGQAGWALEVVK